MHVKIIINLKCLYIIYFFNLTYPLECLQVPPGVHVPPFENHCITPLKFGMHLWKSGNSALWHFIIALLNYTSFKNALNLFWAHRCKSGGMQVNVRSNNCVNGTLSMSQETELGEGAMRRSKTILRLLWKKISFGQPARYCTHGALVRSSFQSITQMDAPSQYFFWRKKMAKESLSICLSSTLEQRCQNLQN